MIDIENELFNHMSTLLHERYDPILVANEYALSPAIFPSVTIEEKNNTPLTRTQDSGSLENHVTLLYAINVYSNKKSGRKQECKMIFNTLDNEFQRLGFTRTLRESIPNLADATIYRLIGRYTAVVSKDKIIYRG